MIKKLGEAGGVGEFSFPGRDFRRDGPYGARISKRGGWEVFNEIEGRLIEYSDRPAPNYIRAMNAAWKHGYKYAVAAARRALKGEK